MTPRERVAHLLRRFGLGATERELAFCEPLGVEGTLDYLLDFEKIEEQATFTPWECACDENGRIVLERDEMALWWATRMLLTSRPLEARLTLFWHNHFALGGSKIDFAPMFVDYVECLRRNCAGKFSTLLDAVARDPAMLRYLDADRSVRAHPNENFAREVMELFTIGPDAFTETDVREVARCYTGFTWQYRVNETTPEYATAKTREHLAAGRPLVTSVFNIEDHDDGEKTIFGRTGKFDASELHAILARRPETASRICRKLWVFFGGSKWTPDLEILLTNRFRETDGSIKEVLRAIAMAPEFWDPEVVRGMIKSPFDFVAPVLRQCEVTRTVAKFYRKPPHPLTAIDLEIRRLGYLLFAEMSRQGMTLLNPPDVSGWRWESAWITPSNMIQRIKLADFVFAPGTRAVPMASVVARSLRDRKVVTVEHVVMALCSIFDFAPSERTKWILMRSCSKAGGVKALKDPDKATYMLTVVGRLMFGAPEFQFF